MTYAGVHRDVAFSVHCVNGAWRYTINKESFGKYTERDHAIRDAIQHIDRMLFRLCSCALGEGRIGDNHRSTHHRDIHHFAEHGYAICLLTLFARS